MLREKPFEAIQRAASIRACRGVRIAYLSVSVTQLDVSASHVCNAFCGAYGEVNMYTLIVDDSCTVRQILIKIVQYFGCTAIGYASGREALHHLHTRDENPRLIFLDVAMPNLNAWDVLHALRSDPCLAAIPVVMMSAGGDYATQARVNGATNFLAKPIDISNVQSMVRLYCKE